MTRQEKYDFFPKDPFHTLGRVLFSVFTYTVFHFYTRIIIQNRSALPNGAFIICSNHQSHLDGIILSYVGCFNFSRTAMIAAKDYWYDNKKRYYISRFFFNTIPISRNLQSESFNMLETARASRQFVEKGGRCIVILPEGTRSKDGQIRTFKKGITTLARATELPVVPVYIEDSGKYWAKGSFFLRPGSIRVIVGNPILPEALKESDATEIIQSSVVSLSKL